MTIVIIEDENLAADKIGAMLREIEPEAKIVAKIRSVETALEWFSSHETPDLIISDIQLLDGLCFEIFRQIDIECPVIFTTAFDQYAIRAFEVHSLDYLLKPVQAEKLRKSIAKFKLQHSRPEPLPVREILEMMKLQKVAYKSRFMVRFGQRIVAIPVEEIAYFFSESKLSFIVTEDGKKYPIDQPLNEVELLLDPKLFFRINRQLIIKFSSIAEMHPYFKGRIKLMLQPVFAEEIVVSSEKTPEFKKWLEQ